MKIMSCKRQILKELVATLSKFLKGLLSWRLMQYTEWYTLRLVRNAVTFQSVKFLPSVFFVRHFQVVHFQRPVSTFDCDTQLDISLYSLRSIRKSQIPLRYLLRTSSEPASVMECWFKQQPACLSSHTVDLRWTMDDVLLYSTHPVEQLAVNVNQMRKRFCYNSAHIHKVTVT